MSPVEHALIDMTCVGEDQISDEEDMFLGYKLSHIHVQLQQGIDQLSGVVNMLLAH